MAERDELAELRALWRRVEPPPLASEGHGGDEQREPETARAVEWMRAAWARIEPPVAVVRARPRRRALRRVAAAAVLLAAGLAAWNALPGTLRDPSSPSPGPRVAAGGVAPEPATNEPEQADPIRIASLEDGKIEMRSGPVRLILVRP